MSTPKITIIYYSTYSTNHGVAQAAAKAAEDVGAEVRLRRVAETAPAEVVAGQDAWKRNPISPRPRAMTWTGATGCSFPRPRGSAP
jgi:NAD(P)H dehydrogenase (quinone)